MALNLLSVIDDALGLAFATRQRIRFAERNDYRNAKNLFDRVLELLGELFHVAHGVAHHVARNFNLDFERIHVVLGIENDLVVRKCLFGAEECGFDLAREHVHAAHDDHVVATAANAADTADRAAAGYFS